MSRANDRMDIADLVTRYAWALDARDWELLRTVFTPGCQVQYPGSPHLDGFEQVWRFCERALKRYRATQHLLGNIQADVDGDSATAATYLQAVHVAFLEEGGDIFILGGIYRDRLVRTDDGWRIAERILESWWTRTSLAETSGG